MAVEPGLRKGQIPFVFFAALCAVWLSAGTVSGQQASSIIGQVRDTSGAVLPGVTVTATSPALQVPEVTTVTDASGEYRLTPLPIGTFTVVYTLSGFQTVRREDIRLTVGFVARVDIELPVGALAETVTVSGQSPVVDTTSSNTQIQLTQETLQLVPGSRHSVNGMMELAPGVVTTVDVGGSGSDETPRNRAFGIGAEPWYVIEGVTTITLNPAGALGILWDYSAVDETALQTTGGGVETPTRGIYVNAVAKSGSNTFHGSANLLHTSSAFGTSNLDDKLRAQGLTDGNRMKFRYDQGFELSGRIIPDKLWFFTGSRRRGDSDEVTGIFTMPDGSPMEDLNTSWFHTNKVSLQLNPGNRIIGFISWNHKTQKNIGNANLNPYERLSEQETLGSQSKVEYQAVRNSLVFSGLWALSQYQALTDPVPEAGGVGKPSFTDVFTLVNGGQGNGGVDVGEHRPQFKVKLTSFRPDFYKGNHEFLVGFEGFPTRGGRGNHSRGAAGDYTLEFNRGVAFQLRTFNYPVIPLERSNYVALYGQDTWTIGRQLTLAAGLRYAHDSGFIPANCHPGGQFVQPFCFEKIQFPIWNTIVPRIHASYDLTGQGRTVIKGGYGLFPHMRHFGGELSSANPMSTVTTVWRWTDPNGNRNYDPGEVDLNPNGPAFVSQSGGTNTVVNPDEEEPMSHELSASFEHELMKDLAFRLTAVQTILTNTYRVENVLRPYSVYSIPITRPDPGPDGIAGNADDPGRSLTYYDYPTSLRGRAFEQFRLMNDEAGKQTNRSVELSAYKRLSDRWQLSGSITVTKKKWPLGGGTSYVMMSTQVADLNPNAEINAADNTTEKIMKAQGAYQFPLGITGSFSFQSLQGTPLARTVLVTGGTTIPSLTMRVEPLGTISIPRLNLTNLRARKAFRLPGGQRIDGEVNMYNAFNVNTITGMTVASGPNYLRPSTVILPRLFDFSVRYSF